MIIDYTYLDSAQMIDLLAMVVIMVAVQMDNFERRQHCKAIHFFKDRTLSILHFYDAGELIRLLQGATKIRPIGKATTHSNIVDVRQQLPHREELQEEFGNIQFFCGESFFGVERMKKAINEKLSVNPHLSYSSSNDADAYSNSERGLILRGVAKVMLATLLPIQRRLTEVQDVV